MTTPEFFSKEWAEAVGDALTAGPSEQARAGKLQMYWDFFELIKGGYQASWALGCRDLPAGPRESGAAPAYLFVQWGGGAVTDARIIGPDSPLDATYVLSMDYADWKALHEGYDAQRTVMYRKILLESGDLLEFFKSIYFFVECLAVIGGVSADYPADRIAAVRPTAAGLPARSTTPYPERPVALASPVSLLFPGADVRGAGGLGEASLGPVLAECPSEIPRRPPPAVPPPAAALRRACPTRGIWSIPGRGYPRPGMIILVYLGIFAYPDI